jgi:DNA adenine methylase
MFFALEPNDATLSDANEELIATYAAVRTQSRSVVRALTPLRYSKREFYRVRATKPTTAVSRAARFIYLNRTAWNGLYRVNQQGKFNVPFGEFNDPMANVGARVLAVAPRLRGVRLLACDFTTALQRCDRHDFVYLDPPYVSRHRFNGFLRYNANVFGWADQERLRDAVAALEKQDVHFLLSNADHPSIERLYRGFEIRRITRKSLVAGSNEHRTPVTELLISNYELPRRFNG